MIFTKLYQKQYNNIILWKLYQKNTLNVHYDPLEHDKITYIWRFQTMFMRKTILVHRLYRHLWRIVWKITYFAHFRYKYTTINRPNTLRPKYVLYLYLYYVAKEGRVDCQSIYTPRRSDFITCLGWIWPTLHFCYCSYSITMRPNALSRRIMVRFITS